MSNTACFSCKTTFTDQTDFSRHSECPNCHRPTKVCKNCSFFDNEAYNECREPNAERVLDKEKSNFCNYFSPASNNNGPLNGENLKQKWLNAAEALFKVKK